jgi:hypothetical protein
LLFYILSLETPINREVGGDEEFAAALHPSSPLFTHILQHINA